MCLITVQDVEIPDPHYQTANLKHEFCHRCEIKSRDAKGKLIIAYILVKILTIMLFLTFQDDKLTFPMFLLYWTACLSAIF